MEDLKKLQLLTELFEMEDGELKPENVLEDLDCWDSMMRLSLIVMIDEECGKKVSGEDIKSFETVRDIMDFME